MWRQLSNSQLGHHKFRRQAVIFPYICDFFCPAKGLIVEVDEIRMTRLLMLGGISAIWREGVRDGSPDQSRR